MKKTFLYIASVVFLITLGCSTGSENPTDADIIDTQLSRVSHGLWGLWQFVADPVEGSLDITPLRTGDFHINVLPFLEPPPLLYLTLESLEFNGNIIDADIGLRHPFLGLIEFTGFDVSGILITNGSVTGFTDNNLRMAGDGDTRLLNADGYSRWWNPAEFPMNGTAFGYVDGLLGTPDSYADYNCTLNGYKYFCDDLDDPDDPLTDVTLANRGMFSAGQKNVRHYTIELGSEGMIFNYAVDACWQFPEGDTPWQVPDDFAPGANRPEAWNISVTETSNTLWNDGGDNGGNLSLQIDVYDWYNPELNTVRVESPGNFTIVESSIPTGGGDGYSTYEIDTTDATPSEDAIGLLISIVSEDEDFGGFISGVNTTAYFTYTAPVADEPLEDNQKNIPLREGIAPYDIAFDPVDGRVLIIYDDEEVWKYMPSDSYQFPNPNQKFYDCEWHLLDPWPGHDFYIQKAYIDIADNHVAIIDFTWNPGVHVNRSWNDIIDGTGSLIERIVPIGIYFGISYVNHDVAAWGENGSNPVYHNRVASIWGHSVPYYTFLSYALEPENYQYDHYYDSGNMGWGPPPPYGKNKIFGVWVRGMDVDKDDMHIWALETEDYYAARFMNITYDNAFFGTGSQTDSDIGFNNPRDLTRDVNNNLIALDWLSDDTSRMKGFDPTNSTDTVPAESLGGMDLDDAIIGPALRIDCSNYVHPTYGNLLVVMHGDDTEGYYMSFFKPDELPW